jgi:Nucleotidyl transferase AbiEii toxin, Type IV TA system
VPDPVDGDHALLLRIALPVCHAYGLALAGGYAIKAHGLVSRPSDDLDLATATTTPVQEIVTALAGAYRAAGLHAKVLDAHGRKGHLTVGLPTGATYRVDVLKEPLSQPPVVMDIGPVLSAEHAVQDPGSDPA